MGASAQPVGGFSVAMLALQPQVLTSAPALSVPPSDPIGAFDRVLLQTSSIYVHQ